MKISDLLMNSEMVRATLREIDKPGTGKTQTRRLINSLAGFGKITEFEVSGCSGYDWQLRNSRMLWNDIKNERLMNSCPYGKPGDLIYVRETFRMAYPKTEYSNGIVFRADKSRSLGMDEYSDRHRWKPSIHMPRWASRITLEITDVRVQRLNNISEEDAKAEGVESLETEREEHDWSICPRCGGTLLWNRIDPASGGMNFDTDCFSCDTQKKRFQHLWEYIYGPESWQVNPWVWAISFKPHLMNVDSMVKIKEAM